MDEKQQWRFGLVGLRLVKVELLPLMRTVGDVGLSRGLGEQSGSGENDDSSDQARVE
jgi:hypothetical protein